MSGGRQFVRTLEQLGYKGKHELHEEAFDWLFEEKEIVNFLDWFSENVNKDNLLDKKKVDKYESMKASGKLAILDGQQLQDAIQDDVIADDDLSDDQLRDEILCLERSCKHMASKKERLIQRRNKLSVHQTRLSHKLTKMTQIESKYERELSQNVEQVRCDNLQMNTCLSKLSTNIHDLCQLYTQTNMKADSTTSDANFLSQISLNDYYKEEDKFTQELTQYTKRQFFKDVSQIASSDDLHRYTLLDIQSPTDLIVCSESEEVFKKECKELLRIQSEYPAEMYRNISGQVQLLSNEVAVKCARQKLHSLQQSPYTVNESELRQQLHSAKSKLQNVKRTSVILYESQLPKMVKAVGEVQKVKMLTGDYDLKIARQDYFTSKQEQVIRQMNVQRARTEFLTMAFEVEKRKHRQTHQLLTGISGFLEKWNKSLQSRMTMLSEPCLLPAKTARQIIDSRDKFIIRLHNILVDTPDSSFREHKPMFQKYETLVDGAEKIVSQLSTLALNTYSNDDVLTLFEKGLHKCEEVLYCGSSTKGGSPQLSPPDIGKYISNLNQMLDLLEETLLDIMASVNSKKKTLQTSPFLVSERGLFVHFFTDAAKLRKIFSDLYARLEAKRVS
ncbi:HAUS augmin-like complex subunit 3 [Saccoglossus kowalevskii]|uniref:HAUS augmin-like complex subunit 3-like n=1 Tax=Saccoglossus kowalevskii TaxID=10224 RepID=A0ABM0GNH0_SACKO|nr:PREDICTED: HAUS augmin-like complex subunit 3-like [Saccoglossus kowalevskii]